MKDILIVEDNDEIALLLCDLLENEGFSVNRADSGEKAIELFETEGAKVVILDIMLPGMDGFSVCQKIRACDNTPIIILSAKDTREDKLNGLHLGADDYLDKPCDFDILIAKIRGIFKRRYDNDVLVCKDLVLDRQRRSAVYCGSELTLTTKEFELLLMLVENQNVTLSKNVIFNHIWGNDSESEDQTLTVHIRRLREKLEKDPKNPTHIITVWGTGYRYET